MKEFCLKQDAFFIFFLSTYSTQTTKHDQTVRMYESKPIIVAIQIIRVLGFAYLVLKYSLCDYKTTFKV